MGFIWSQIASLALDSKILSAVWIALCNLDDSEGSSQVIRARLYDELGYTTNAINILHTEVITREWVDAQTKETTDIQRQKLENYVRIKRRIEPYDISIQTYFHIVLFSRDYKRLLELGSNSSDVHYNWGKLHDSIYSSQHAFDLTSFFT